MCSAIIYVAQEFLGVSFRGVEIPMAILLLAVDAAIICRLMGWNKKPH